MEFKYIHVGSALDQGGDLGGDQGGFWWPTQWANSFQKPGRASGAWGPGGGSQAWLSKQRGGEGRGVGLPESPPSGPPHILSSPHTARNLSPLSLWAAGGECVPRVPAWLPVTVRLSVEGLELFECFHRYTVDTVLGPHPHLHWQGQAALVLPLLNSSPDLDLCRQIQY